MAEVLSVFDGQFVEPDFLAQNGSAIVAQILEVQPEELAAIQQLLERGGIDLGRKAVSREHVTLHITIVADPRLLPTAVQTSVGVSPAQPPPLGGSRR